MSHRGDPLLELVVKTLHHTFENVCSQSLLVSGPGLDPESSCSSSRLRVRRKETSKESVEVMKHTKKLCNDATCGVCSEYASVVVKVVVLTVLKKDL